MILAESVTAAGHTVTAVDPFGVCIFAGDPPAHVRSLPVDWLRALTREHHLVVARGFRNFDTPDALTEFCSTLGEVSLWPFGAVLELLERDNPEDHIFDNNYVPLHWDGMYRPQIPEFQVFQCVSAPLSGQGGRTTFSNTASVLERADAKVRAVWDRVTGTYHRKMEYYESKIVSPIVTPHPTRGFPVIRYNELVDPSDTTFVNHPNIVFSGIPNDELPEFHRSLVGALHAPEHFYAHTWRTGDLVITDNYSLLHGREAFTSRAPRHLRRVHVLGQPPLDNPGLVS